MNDPMNPLGWSVWKRGARLGLIWAVLFFVTTGALYVLMGPLGWSTAARALCAMLIGPVLASAMIGAWWLSRRAVLSEALKVRDVPPKGRGEANDEPDRRGDSPTV